MTTRDRPWEELSAWVAGRASMLQRRYRANEAGAVRQLAVLRRVRSGGLGDPEVWAALDGLPTSLVGRGDAPAAGERAAYDALVLFAAQQQGHRDQDLHVPGQRLGEALRRLRDGEPERDPIVRRFKQLGSAGTYESMVWHLRGLVTQLRGGSGERPVGLDYGRLAADLYRWQQPDGDDPVRLVWGRDFYRAATSTAPTTDTPDNSSLTEGDQP